MFSFPTTGRFGSAMSLGLGTAPIGNLYRSVSDDVAASTIDAAWQAGIRYFDTAPHYGLGLSERRLGAGLKDRPRADYILSTKVGRLLRPNPAPKGRDAEGFDVPDDVLPVRDYSADGVKRSIEESLNRLDTDRIDIVFIHDPDDFWDEAIAGAVPALSDLRDQGVITAYGVGMNQYQMLHRFVTETDIDLVMLAGRYTLLDHSALDSLMPACLQRNVDIVNVGIFNSGLLSKARLEQGATFNYTRASQDLLARANLLADVCDAHGTTLPAAAIAFAARHPSVKGVVLGMRTPDEVHQNTALTQSDVPDSLWEDLHQRGLIPVIAEVPTYTNESETPHIGDPK